LEEKKSENRPFFLFWANLPQKTQKNAKAEKHGRVFAAKKREKGDFTAERTEKKKKELLAQSRKDAKEEKGKANGIPQFSAYKQGFEGGSDLV